MDYVSEYIVQMSDFNEYQDFSNMLEDPLESIKWVARGRQIESTENLWLYLMAFKQVALVFNWFSS